jgi:membrane protein
MLRHLKDFWHLAVLSFQGWMDDGAASMGAALAFYTLFSMAPLLLLAISIAGLVIGSDVARDLLLNQLTALLGEKGAGAVASVLAAADEKGETVMAAAISVVTLVIGATTVFEELQRDLDKIWRYEAPKTRGLWRMIQSRVLSSGMILVIGFLLMVSLVLSAAVTAVGSMWASGLPGEALLLRVLEFAGSFLVITGLFAMIYKILPNQRIEWRDVWVGAAVTSLLFWIGKYLIGLYLGKSAVASPFGAAGTLIVVIVWVYYSAQIFFLGAEFTHIYAVRRGSRRDSAANDPRIT